MGTVKKVNSIDLRASNPASAERFMAFDTSEGEDEQALGQVLETCSLTRRRWRV